MAEFTKEQLREHLDMRLTHTRKSVQENTGTGWVEFYEKEVSVLEIALAALTAGMEQTDCSSTAAGGVRCSGIR